MDRPLYLLNPYLKEFEATVTKTDRTYVVLDQTAFYPNAGGQPFDKGVIERLSDHKVFGVVYVGKFNDTISHEVDQIGLQVGDKVKCRIDWERRYIHMRMHTAAHVLSKVIFDSTGAKTSGNQLGEDQSRIDFTLENFDRDRIFEWFQEVNKRIQKGAEVHSRLLSREEAFRIPDLVRSNVTLIPETVKVIRVVDIPGVDIEACGGTHLRNISEIGKIVFLKAENKGKDNRRIYFTLE
ncbi:MAG TPA: alanyl-tRNA editing protein [archaeon]|nr:alanyl-tRNA editing protein [archaeon]